jgi:hypothetical protein
MTLTKWPLTVAGDAESSADARLQIAKKKVVSYRPRGKREL